MKASRWHRRYRIASKLDREPTRHAEPCTGTRDVILNQVQDLVQDGKIENRWGLRLRKEKTEPWLRLRRLRNI